MVPLFPQVPRYWVLRYKKDSQYPISPELVTKISTFILDKFCRKSFPAESTIFYQCKLRYCRRTRHTRKSMTAERDLHNAVYRRGSLIESSTPRSERYYSCSGEVE
ncbi:hypothetical protein J6590_019692 [Homalodisca vitripennis]|nr:hypothetical protein J6590_019692 [Homalodisca vitripennis]